MSLKVSFSPTIPDGTQQLVEPLLPTENLYRFIGQEIQNILREADFAEVYAETGRPGISPVVLALVTVYQFVEKLPDRQATEMAVMRLDWKYALHQPLDWQGFHYTDLCHFRQRLLKHDCEGLVFERVVTYLRDKGYVKGGGKQRTDSTHILAAVHVLSTLELLRETLKTTLQALISHNAPWTVKHLPGSFVQPHLHPASEYGLNKAEIEQALAELGREGDWLWQQVQQQGSDDLRQLPEVRLFWQVWREHFHWERGALHFSPTGHYKGSFIVSPHDVEARRGAKGSRSWIGYKAQVTEAVGQGGQASFITDLALTSAIETDNQALTAIQQRLLQRQLSPGRQYVDQGYMSAENLANSQQQGINLRGYSMGNESGKPTGFRLEDFQINLEQRTATCPAGRSAKSFLDYEPTRRNHIRFRVYFGTQCRACAFFSAERCTNRHYGRVLSLHPHFTVLQARRREEITPAFAQEMRLRRGVEGTISELVRRHGLRRLRYRGQRKGQLQLAFIGAAANLKRLTATFGRLSPLFRHFPFPLTFRRSFFNKIDSVEETAVRFTQRKGATAMAGTKRKYDTAFKQEALRLLEISGKSVRQIEDELGITPGLLNQWKVRYRLHPETGAVKPSEQHDLESENRRLRRELELVKAERELLKKVVKLFSADAP